MPDKYEIALPDLSKVDPDHDGKPGISFKLRDELEKIDILVAMLNDKPTGSASWQGVLYLLFLEYANNLDLLLPFTTSIPLLPVLLKLVTFTVSKYAGYIGIKEVDLRKELGL